MSTDKLHAVDDSWNPAIVDEAEIAELMAGEVLDIVMTDGADILFSRYISTKTVPHTVDATLAMFANMMEMKHNRMDIGETEPWAEEKEPLIAKIDAWGRSSIPVRKKVVYKIPEQAVALASD